MILLASVKEAATRANRVTEEQIIRVIWKGATGASVRDLSRRHRISDKLYYRWRRRYGGLEVPDAKRWNVLENESRKLKQLLAGRFLDDQTVRAILDAATSLAGHRSQRRLSVGPNPNSG